MSPALVSYVLQGGPRPVSADARRRIEAAIAELGYRPNAIAQALRGGQTHTVGLLTPSPANPLLAELAEALEKEFFRHGVVLAIGITDSNPERERSYLRAFLDRQMDGLLLISVSYLENLPEVAAVGRPAVVVDTVPPDFSGYDQVSFVHTDNVLGATAVVEHLQGHGHRRIACVAGVSTNPMVRERVDAWRAAQLARGLPADDRLVVEEEFSEAGGVRAGMALLGRDARDPVSGRPTAVFVASDVQAFGVLAACHRLGLRVPEDVALGSFDGTRRAFYDWPSLTTYRQPIDEIARLTSEHLRAAALDPGRPTLQRAVPGFLVVGESCGCPPSAPV